VTPFGEKLRSLRAERGLRQADMAAALEISAAYLSALEHGKRGAPSAGLIHQVCAYFGLIWDDADELMQLARVSKPRVRLNLAGLTAAQVALGNRLAKGLRALDPDAIAAIHRLLDEALPAAPRRPTARAPASGKTGSGETGSGKTGSVRSRNAPRLPPS
jgi:transcriptional regulator with XRE-family HTH domain